MDHFVVRVLFLCAVATSSPLVAAETKRLFDGKTLTGWEGDTKNTWRVEKGAIVGGSLGLPHEAAPCSKLESGRRWPASDLAEAERRAEQMLAATSTRGAFRW